MPPAKSAPRKALYQALADELQGAIDDGRLAAGTRLPSVRESATSRRLSINTVLAAYRQLEAHGWIEARPQAGYFVRARLAAPASGLASTTPPKIGRAHV